MTRPIEILLEYLGTIYDIPWSTPFMDTFDQVYKIEESFAKEFNPTLVVKYLKLLKIVQQRYSLYPNFQKVVDKIANYWQNELDIYENVMLSSYGEL